MGRSPCCSKEEMNRGAWTAMEDKTLADYIRLHGEGKWRTLPKKAGLKRCGKSCKLRWLNYLRPDIKRDNITPDEEELIIRLHKLLGNRWSLIVGRLSGRTHNEIKNYWNTKIRKNQSQNEQSPNSSNSKLDLSSVTDKPISTSRVQNSKLVWTKVSRCNKAVLTHEQLVDPPQHIKSALAPPSDNAASNSIPDNAPLQELAPRFVTEDLTMDFEMDEHLLSDLLNTDLSDFSSKPNQLADDVLVPDDTCSYFPLVTNCEMDPSNEFSWLHGSI